MEKLLTNSLPPKPYLQIRRLKFKMTQPEAFELLQDKRRICTETSFSYKPLDDTQSIFIHVPKCAGVSITKVLYGNLAGGHTTLDGYLNIFEPSEILSYFKFAFVRNPWDRLVSAFHFLKAGGLNSQDKNWSDRNLQEFSEFNDFVRRWLNKDNIWKYHHFHPQCHYVRDPHNKVTLDFIGLFENLDNDFAYVAKRLEKDSALPKVNASSRKDYRTYYNDETRKIVEDVYAQDIGFLGYSFDNSSVKSQIQSRTVSNGSVVVDRS